MARWLRTFLGTQCIHQEDTYDRTKIYNNIFIT